jgi:predicted phosphodiesterase
MSEDPEKPAKTSTSRSASNKQVLHDQVREFIKKNPDMPNRTIARVFVKKSNGVYGIEQVRATVRGIRGRIGEKNRNKYMDKSLYLPKEKVLWNPYDIPESHNDPFEAYDLPIKNGDGLILADIHFPYHDMNAINTALEYGSKRNIKFIILDGDILDFYQLSRFQKDPQKRNAHEEIDMAKQFFASLKKHFPKAMIIYKLGNHEDRWNKWWWQHAREMGDIYSRDLAKELDLENMKIPIVGGNNIIRHKELNIAHGHEIVRGMGNQVSPARTVYLKAKEIIAVAHFHRESTNSLMTLNGKLITTWSIGCMCDLHPDWMPHNEWNHGFALLSIGGDEHEPWRFENHRIYKGKVF